MRFLSGYSYSLERKKYIKMKLNLKNILQATAIIAIITMVSSCNRGYGCPSNFSIDNGIETLVQTIVNLF